MFEHIKLSLLQLGVFPKMRFDTFDSWSQTQATLACVQPHCCQGRLSASRFAPRVRFRPWQCSWGRHAVTRWKRGEGSSTTTTQTCLQKPSPTFSRAAKKKNKNKNTIILHQTISTNLSLPSLYLQATQTNTTVHALWGVTRSCRKCPTTKLFFWPFSHTNHEHKYRTATHPLPSSVEIIRHTYKQTNTNVPGPMLEEILDVNQDIHHVLRWVPIGQLQHLHVGDALHQWRLQTRTNHFHQRRVERMQINGEVLQRIMPNQ